MTKDINFSSIIVNDVGDLSLALPTFIESTPFIFKYLPVPSVG